MIVEVKRRGSWEDVRRSEGGEIGGVGSGRQVGRVQCRRRMGAMKR